MYCFFWSVCLGCLIQGGLFSKDSPLQVLSFTNFQAQDLGDKLLGWGKPEWNHGHVTVQKVRNSKKKNKGKAYQRGEGKGKGKSLEVKQEPQFPQAPWWKMPEITQVTEQTVEEIHDDSEDEEKEENNATGGFRAFGPWSVNYFAWTYESLRDRSLRGQKTTLPWLFGEDEKGLLQGSFLS